MPVGAITLSGIAVPAPSGPSVEEQAAEDEEDQQEKSDSYQAPQGIEEEGVTIARPDRSIWIHSIIGDLRRYGFIRSSRHDHTRLVALRPGKTVENNTAADQDRYQHKG